MTFEKFMEAEFMDEREVNGIPITKDNCEDLFENWLGNLQIDDWFKYGDDYAKTVVQ